MMNGTGVRGTFADMSLGYLLQWMGLSRQSGRLEFRGKDASWQLGFLRGRILEGRRMHGNEPVETSRDADTLGQWLREPLDWLEGAFAFHPVKVNSGPPGPGIEVPALLLPRISEEAQPEAAFLLPPEQGEPELQVQVVETLLRKDFTLPVLSQSALRVQRMARDQRTTFKSLAEVISSDPALSSAVLSCANSAASGASGTIDALPLAVARLGFRTILSLSYSTCLQSRRIATPSLLALQHRLWSHSLGVALLARLAAVKARVDDEQAFLCGLMHDVGRAVLLGVVESLLARKRLKHVPKVEEIEPLLSCLHTRVGRGLPAQWHLPESVLHAMCFHHHLGRVPEEGRRLVAVVALANGIANHQETHAELPEASALAETPPAKLLAFEPTHLESLLRAAEPLFEQSRSLVG
jgi:HD-like signal output (HDOD) protein